MYAIKAVAQKTGLTTHTIRVWERRYDILKPVRTETNRRLYSEQDVHKLALLKKAIDLGHSIGQLAQLSNEEISKFVQEQENLSRVSHAPFLENYSIEEKSPDYYVQTAMKAIKEFNSDLLDNILVQASVNLSQPQLIDHVLIPFLDKLGEEWFEGNIRIVEEHIGSAVFRTFLGRLLASIQSFERGPVIATATVSGLLHEFGAMLVALSAAALGWRARYLGPNLPVEEIVYSVQKMNAKALSITITYPQGDELIREQIKYLSKLLPTDVKLLIGGKAATSYKQTLQEIGAFYSDNIHDLRQELKRMKMKL